MIPLILPAAEPLGELVSATHEIAVNTCPEPWYTDGFTLVAVLSLLIACISFSVAWRTLKYTRKTVESIECGVNLRCEDKIHIIPSRESARRA